MDQYAYQALLTIVAMQRIWIQRSVFRRIVAHVVEVVVGEAPEVEA